jgi:hypothetical protein
MALLLVSFPLTAAFADTPPGTIAFFDGSPGVCPTNWSPQDEAAGYLLVATSDPNNTNRGQQIGVALEDQQIPMHGHDYSLNTVIPPKVIAAAGGAGSDLGKAKRYTLEGRSAEASTNLPLLQLQLCIRDNNPAPDTMPPGSVMFFGDSASQCPTDWAPYSPAGGRFVVPLVAGGENRLQVGDTPLPGGAERPHAHFVKPAVDGGSAEGNSNVDVRSQHVQAQHSCCNHNPARKRDQQAAGLALPEAGGLPFVQYLMCRKSTATGSGPLASGMVAFFGETDTCPGGWSRNVELEGELLVGLPQNATEQAAFGGGPLLNSEARPHHHSFSGEFRPSKTEVVAGTMKVHPYHHWAAYKHYQYEGDFGNDYLPDQNDPDARPYGGPPYIQLLACTRD